MGRQSKPKDNPEQGTDTDETEATKQKNKDALALDASTGLRRPWVDPPGPC